MVFNGTLHIVFVLSNRFVSELAHFKTNTFNYSLCL